MSLPYTKRTVVIASAGTASTALEFDSMLDQTPLVLCAIKPSAAITANTGKITMSPTGGAGTFAAINDSFGAALTFAMSTAVYTQLTPSQYAVFERFIRVEFSAGVSASISLDLYFRPA